MSLSVARGGRGAPQSINFAGGWKGGGRRAELSMERLIEENQASDVWTRVMRDGRVMMVHGALVCVYYAVERKRVLVVWIKRPI